MRTTASNLDHSHLGQRITYGPHDNFSGVLAEVRHLTEEWLGGAYVHPLSTPSRVFVRTVDGRCASLAYDHSVRLEATQERKEDHDRTQLGEGQTKGPSESGAAR